MPASDRFPPPSTADDPSATTHTVNGSITSTRPDSPPPLEELVDDYEISPSDGHALTEGMNARGVNVTQRIPGAKRHQWLGNQAVIRQRMANKRADRGEPVLKQDVTWRYLSVKAANTLSPQQKRERDEAKRKGELLES